MKTCLYALSADPVTNGHVYVVNQALKNFDTVVIAVANNPEKKYTFGIEDRIKMISDAFKNSNVKTVIIKNEFTANYCRDNGIKTMIRGIRNVKDLEYEQQIQSINERINPELQTIYFIPPSELAGLSSSLVKGLIGEREWQFVVRDLVPENVMEYLILLKYEKAAKELLSDFFYRGLGVHPQSPICEKWAEKIIKLYSSNRYYHNWQHIVEMYDETPNEPIELRMATLFHDIIYDVTRNDNEEESVEIFYDCVRSIMSSFPNMNKNPHFNSETVEELIMATKNHQGSMNELVNQFIDMDLDIFSKDKNRVMEYERQIRQEYINVPTDVYKIERIKILKSFLSRPYVYLTEYSRIHKENKAKENILFLIQSLESK